MSNTDKRLDELEKRVKILEEKTFIPVSIDDSLIKARDVIKQYSTVSASFLQRTLSIGYARAARLLDKLEEEGLVEKSTGGTPRKVLKKGKS